MSINVRFIPSYILTSVNIIFVFSMFKTTIEKLNSLFDIENYPKLTNSEIEAVEMGRDRQLRYQK